MRKISQLLFLSLVLFLSACSSEKPESILDDTDEAKVDETVKDKTEIGAVIGSIPSPLETTTLIKESGLEYSDEYLNSPESLRSYSSSFQKAVNLGVYGADLGYINIYEENFAAIKYLEVVKSLADDLRVGQFFDFETIKRMATNSGNIDSMLYISTSGFDRMNNYLTKQKRNNVSVLILVGGWLETTYLTSELASSIEHKALMEKIGDQKYTLEQVLKLVTVYRNDPEFQGLIKDLEDLNTIYQDVNITIEYGEPIEMEVDGIMMMVDQSTSTIEISKETFAAIRAKIAAIRKTLI